MADRETSRYYDTNASSYGNVAPRPDGNFVAYRRAFIERLAPHSRVLDLGCGGGHASLAFIEAGFDVVPLDGSPALAEIATKRIGADVVVKDFSALDYNAEFDGVWAAASLTHVPRSELANVFLLVCSAIREQGLLVASFKCAEEDWRDEHGRFYCAMSPGELSRIAAAAGFNVSKIELAPGQGRDYESATWAWLFANARKR